MKTLTAGQTAAVAANGADAHRFVSVAWPAASGYPEMFYCERKATGGTGGLDDDGGSDGAAVAVGEGGAEWSPDPTYDLVPTLLGYPEVDCAADLGLEPVGQLRSLTFQLLNDPGATPTLFAILAAADPTGATVTLWSVYRPVGGGNPAAADWICGGVFAVTSKSSTGNVVTFTCEDRFTRLTRQSVAGGMVSQTSFPGAPAASLGKNIPEVWGLVSGVPGIAVTQGAAGTLYAEIIENDVLLGLNEDATAWPASGTVLVESEVLTYASVQTPAESASGMWTLAGLARGREGTTAAQHAGGSAVRVLLDIYTYLLAGNALSVPRVYLDGALLAFGAWTVSGGGTDGTSQLVKLWRTRLPRAIASVDTVVRDLNTDASDAEVPQALWELLSLEGEDPAASPENAMDGDATTYATLTGSALGQRLATLMKTNYSGVEAVLRHLELRVRYRGYTPPAVGNLAPEDWPEAVPFINVLRWNAATGLYELIVIGGKTNAEINAPLDMDATTNLYPDGAPDANSTQLFQGETQATVTFVSDDTHSNFQYMSGESKEQGPYGYVLGNPMSLVWPPSLENVEAWTPNSSPGTPMRMPPAWAGYFSYVRGSAGDWYDCPLDGAVSDLVMRLDPSEINDDYTYGNIHFSMDCRAFPLAATFPGFNGKAKPKIYFDGSNVEWQVVDAGADPNGSPVPATLTCTSDAVLTSAQLKALRFHVGIVGKARTDWRTVTGQGNFCWDKFTVTATIQSTTPGGLLGQTQVLVGATRVPSAMIEARIDLTGAVEWADLQGKFRVDVVFPAQANASQLWVYELALQAEFTRARYGMSDPSERAVTADVVGIGGPGLVASNAIYQQLVRATHLGLSPSEYDLTGLTAALAIAQGLLTAWPVARYIGATMTAWDLFAETVAQAGLRFGCDGPRIRFWPAIGPAAGESSLQTLTEAEMTDQVGIETSTVDLLKNELACGYALDPATGQPSAMVTVSAAAGGAVGTQSASMTWAWIYDALVAARLGAIRLSDSSAVKSTYSAPFVAYRMAKLELGDVATVSDAYLGLAATLARVVAIARPGDGASATVSIVTATAPVIDSSAAVAGTGGNRIYVSTAFGTMYWEIGGVVVAMLDVSGNLTLKGKLVETDPSGAAMAALVEYSTVEDASGAWRMACRIFYSPPYDDPVAEVFEQWLYFDHLGNLHMAAGAVAEVGTAIPGTCTSLTVTDQASRYLTWGGGHSHYAVGVATTFATYLTPRGTNEYAAYLAAVPETGMASVRLFVRRLIENGL